MKKKIFTICAMAIMCVFVFAGCNDKKDGDVTTTESTTVTETETAEETETETTEDTGEDLKGKLESAVTEATKKMDDMTEKETEAE